MDFDLSLIDQVEAGTASQAPIRSSKFVPRASGRLRSRPREDEAKPGDRQPGSIAAQAESLPSNEASMEAESLQTRLQQTRKTSHIIEGEKESSSDFVLPTHRYQEGRAPGSPKSPITRQHQASSSRRQNGEWSSSPRQLVNLPAASPISRGEGPQSGGPSCSLEQLAMVAVDTSREEEEEKEANEEAELRKRLSAGGRGCQPGKGGGKLSIKQLAEMNLEPETNSIKDYVQRAIAQDRLNSREQQKRKHSEIEVVPEAIGQAEAPQPAGNRFAPQLELVDGRLVPKQQSLVVQAQPEAVHMVVREYSNLINNQSHSNRMRASQWSIKETEAFFCAVKCFGTNFELISKLFPGRCRKALANKWRREMKARPDKCGEALSGGDGSEGYQRIVEALQEGEGAGEGEVANLGVEATQLFGTGLSDQITEVDPMEIDGWQQQSPKKRPRISSTAGRGSLQSPGSHNAAETADNERVKQTKRKKAGREQAPATSLPPSPQANENLSSSLARGKGRGRGRAKRQGRGRSRKGSAGRAGLENEIAIEHDKDEVASEDEAPQSGSPSSPSNAEASDEEDEPFNPREKSGRGRGRGRGRARGRGRGRGRVSKGPGRRKKQAALPAGTSMEPFFDDMQSSESEAA